MTRFGIRSWFSGWRSFAITSLLILSMSVKKTSGLIWPVLIFWMPSSMLLNVVYSMLTPYLAVNSFSVCL